MAIVVLGCQLAGGCAVQYYDEDTSTMHVFGLSYMKMKVPQPDEQTVYQQINGYGLSMGTSRAGGHFTIGYHRETDLDLAENSALCFEWPDSELFNVKVGRTFPEKAADGCVNKEK
jgi:hypothetical protein